MNRKSALLASAILFNAGAHAGAADLGADLGADSADIVVTAQKREQRITDVPMSISAYSGEFLEQIGGNELSRVAAITPGFVVQLQDKFAPGFSIRGLTSNDFSPNAGQRVAIFQDGMPVTQQTAAYGELFDVARVEVEKGPQSTLHGRSALNGGVSIYQNTAADEFGFETKGGLGNYNYRHAQAVVNVPLGETFAVRLGALAKQRDGFVKDALDGSSYNALNSQALRFAAKWEPDVDFRFDLVATYDRDDTKGGVPFKSGTFLPLDPTTGAIIGDLDFWSPTRLTSFGEIEDAFFHRDIFNIAGTANLTINDRLSLTSITGLRWSDAIETGDSDGTPTNMIAVRQQNYGTQVSQELRLNFTDVGPVEGFVGVSGFWADNAMKMSLGYDERAMALLLGGVLQTTAPTGLTNAQINAILGPQAAYLKAYQEDRSITHARTETYDLFGDVTVHAADMLELFAGARVTFDRQRVALQGLLPYGPSTLTGAGLLLQPTPSGMVKTGSNSSTTATGRAGARFIVSPALNFYAVYGVGKRPEVLQINPTTPSAVIPAETLKSGEVGMKFQALDNRLTGDISLFHYKYSNFQTLGLQNGVLATVNAGKADATGVESQLNFAVTRGITVFGSYGWNKARFKAGAYEGNRFRNSPDHKFAVGADFSASVAGGLVSFAPLYSWQSMMFFDDNNDRSDLQVRRPAALSDTKVDEFQGSFGLLSARLDFVPGSERWSLALVGDNLTDETYIVDAGNTGDYFGIPTFIAGTRRTWRVELGVKF